MLPHVSEFNKIDITALPDVHALPEPRQKILWVLTASKKISSLDALSPGQISHILRDSARIDIPRQRVSVIVEQERRKGTVSRIVKKRGRYYKIMKLGEQEVDSSILAPLVIDPSKPFSATRKLADVIRELKGELRYCDPYVGSRTLDFLTDCKGIQKIKLLTVTIQSAAGFKADLAAFNKEHGNCLEVRVLSQGHLHDRYILHDTGMLSMGASLKDVGKKQSFAWHEGNDIARAVQAAFDNYWQAATPI
jgi:hypothetical protein